ncbi:MAG: AAA-like domain-containing protein [candidate division KSB1 bacterium]
MRYFNTSGPCNPQEHYTLMRPALLAEGMEKIRRGKYLTLFAPRQAGKTTFFRLLAGEMLRTGQFIPIILSFENLKNTSKELFYDELNHELHRELKLHGLTPPRTVANPVELTRFFEELRGQCQNLVLIIDEFEGIPPEALGELLHTFRKIYHRREFYALHALMLVGVSTIAELILSSASPFNITDEIAITYFSEAEVRELLRQYTAETGQKFDEEVIRTLFANTNGQPGLTCGLCNYLVETLVTDRTQAVTLSAFYKTLKHYLTERYDKNILNIVQKAGARKDFMLRLLFGETAVPFNVDNPDISFLYANGVVENINGFVEVIVPLYKKRLLFAFLPASNAETGYFVATHEKLTAYAPPEGLNLNAILQRYRKYVAKRGFRAFDTEHLKEGAWHYSLDGFINFFIERLGGETFVEVPLGRGRTDILILLRGKKYLIETKIFTDQTYFQNGKEQLAEYLQTADLEEGYYVVFSHQHNENDVLTQEEIIAGKRIWTHIIQVNFERPSRGRKKRAR